MEKEKFDDFFGSVEKAFVRISDEMAGISFKSTTDNEIRGDEKVSVVIGMVGKNKGRILFETDADTAAMIARGINGEPVEDQMEMYMFLMEFTNTFSGNSITVINNKYRGTELRLTPPAIFSGVGMEVTTPNIQSSSVCLTCGDGTVLLDVGFEGR